jgi:hypothetical protein
MPALVTLAVAASTVAAEPMVVVWAVADWVAAAADDKSPWVEVR